MRGVNGNAATGTVTPRGKWEKLQKTKTQKKQPLTPDF